MRIDLIATCSVGGKRVDTVADCWRSSTMAAERVHVLCLAAALTVDETAHLSAQGVADLINDSADEICAEWCENPEHASSPVGRN
jgi:hypothetical protein